MSTPTQTTVKTKSRVGAQIRQLWQDTQELIRFGAIGLSTLMPLLGFGTVVVEPTTKLIVGLLGVALTYHIFGYVLNDVVDLPVDRLQPQRQKSPLVRGAISPSQALLLALLQLPLMFGIAWWLGASLPSYIALGIGVVCTVIYDLWGKKTAVPPLTDLVQGIAWGMLALFGALATNAPLTLETWLVTAYVALFIVQVNGVPASLRDLETDREAGLITTALYFNAKPLPNQGFVLSKQLKLYSVGVQTAVFLLFIPLLFNGSNWLPTILALLFLSGASYFLYVSLSSGQNRRGFVSSMAFYIILSLLTPLALTLGRVDTAVFALALFLGFLPLFMSSWWYRMLTWLRDKLFS